MAEVKQIVYPLIDVIREDAPSSTVDEGKLSEVIEDAIIDNLEPENTITGFYVPFGRVSDIASVAARAVVEAIGGEGR